MERELDRSQSRSGHSGENIFFHYRESNRNSMVVQLGIVAVPTLLSQYANWVTLVQTGANIFVSMNK
jgi:hypothetical protein